MGIRNRNAIADEECLSGLSAIQAAVVLVPIDLARRLRVLKFFERSEEFVEVRW